MKTEQRGSEKLMNGCSELATLSQDELEQINGGAWGGIPSYNFSSNRVWKVFPFGIIDPDFLVLDQLADLKQISNGI